jgi:hypothetical protein
MTEGRDRGSQHCSGAAVGPAMIRRQEHFNDCGVRQALVCRELNATGMPSCETGDSSEHLLHLMISNREANGNLTMSVVVVLGLHSAVLQPLHAANTQTALAMFIKAFRDRFSHTGVSAFISDMHLQSLHRYTGIVCGTRGLVGTRLQLPPTVIQGSI